MTTPAPSARAEAERLLACPADALWMGPRLERHEGPPPGDLWDWTPMNAQAREWRDAVTAHPSTCRVEWIKRENSAQSGWCVLQGDKRISGPWSRGGDAESWALGYDAALAARQAAARPAPAGDAERLRALVGAADPHIGQVRSDRDGNQYLGCTRSADGTWNTPVIVGASRLTGVSRPWNPFYVRPAHELEEVARFTDEVADLIEFLLNNRHALLAPPADVGAGLPAETINAAIKALEAGAGAGLPPAARDVLAERQRQVEAEGWTPEHDDAHSTGDLAAAAACYALHSVIATNQSPVGDPMEFPPPGWPWDEAWWKPGTARRDLVKAGALILAELERLDRAAGLTEG